MAVGARTALNKVKPQTPSLLRLFVPKASLVS